jgi:UDP-3-O-[3-hydroxymyristoyl] glucosamine N-acyltransferase
VHPTAIIGDDVLIGPDVTVHEYSTVRDGSILSRGVTVGHNCEVIRSVLAEGVSLAHRISLGRTIVGPGSHLGARILVASVHLWCQDMRAPDREISVRLPDGTTYGCGTPKFGAVLGDHCRVAPGVFMGPGTLIGPDSVVYGGVHLPGAIVPPHTVVRPRHDPTDTIQEPRRPDVSYLPVLEPVT